MSRLVNAAKNGTEKLYKRVGCFQQPLDFARPSELSGIRKKFQVFNKKERSGLTISLSEHKSSLTCPNKLYFFYSPVCKGDIFPILDKPGIERGKSNFASLFLRKS
jgi:hypothetical protein